MESDVGFESTVEDVSSERDSFVGSQTSRMVAIAGLAAASAAISDSDVADADNNNVAVTTASLAASAGADEEINRTNISSLSNVAGLLTGRNYGRFAQCLGAKAGFPGDSVPTTVPSIQDVRKFVFQTPRSDKRLLAGLKAHTFSSQAFFSSFAVGLALGSIIAILLKVLSEVSYRVLPFYGK